MTRYPRRRTRITYEGISFLSILAFIVLGSILRQINLLVLLSGLMIAPFFFNWRISRKMLQRVTFRRHAPDWVNAGKPFSLVWEADNDRQAIPAWGVRVVDRLKYEDADRKDAEKVTMVVKPIEPQSSRRVSSRCLLPQRGVCELGPAEASSAFPVGLVRTKVNLPETQVLLVAPRLGMLTDKWTRFTRSSLDGSQSAQSRSSNQQEQFYAIRPWQFGDSRRLIHWRSTAKKNELMVRQFDQQVDRELVVVLDFHAGQATAAEMETALSFLATVVHQSVRGRRRATIGVFSDEYVIFDRSTRNLVGSVMQHLAVTQPAEQTGVATGLKQIYASPNQRRRLPIVISTRSRMAAEAAEGEFPTDVVWIDVSAGESEIYFSLPDDAAGTFVLESMSMESASI